MREGLVKLMPLTFLNVCGLDFRATSGVGAMGTMRRFLKDETGATAIEYALIVVVLSLTIVAAVGTAGNSLAYFLGNNASRLNAAW